MTKWILGLAVAALVIPAAGSASAAPGDHLSKPQAEAFLAAYLRHEMELGGISGFEIGACERRAPNHVACPVTEYGIPFQGTEAETWVGYSVLERRSGRCLASSLWRINDRSIACDAPKRKPERSG